MREGTEDGNSDGIADGIGDGRGVGLQSMRSWGSRHLSGQQAQLVPIGSGNTLQIVLPTDAQLTGRSSGLISQHATGQWSIKWLQDVGSALGSGDGSDEGNFDGKYDGNDDGTGDGSGVGLQSIRSFTPLHSIGQHSGQPSLSNGKASQSGRPKSTHNGGR